MNLAGLDEGKRQASSSHIENQFEVNNDPHREALADAGVAISLSRSAWAAVFFLGFTFQPALTLTVLFIFPVSIAIALELQGSTDNNNWKASGWSLGGSIGFAVAGQFSDYFGRRWVLLTGQAILILGYIVGATAQNLSACIVAIHRIRTNHHVHWRGTLHLRVRLGLQRPRPATSLPALAPRHGPRIHLTSRPHLRHGCRLLQSHGAYAAAYFLRVDKRLHHGRCLQYSRRIRRCRWWCPSRRTYLEDQRRALAACCGDSLSDHLHCSLGHL